MKKVFFSALLLTGGLFACSKADIQNSNLSSNDDVITAPTKAGDMKRTWHDDGSRPWVGGWVNGCVGMGGTCSQSKSVAAIDIQMFEDIKVSSSVISQFVNFESRLVPYFSIATVESVITGDFSVEVLGDFDTEMYFVFSEDGNVVEVMPLTK